MFEQPVVVSSSVRNVMLAVVAGGVALALAQRFERPAPSKHTVELMLSAPTASNAFYASAWSEGPVHAVVEDGEGSPITFTRTIHWIDHCDWVAHEFLIPDGAGEYRYTYEEWPVSCERGYRPFPATPRQGRVHVVRLDGPDASNVSLTPRNGVAHYHYAERRLACPFVAAHRLDVGE